MTEVTADAPNGDLSPLRLFLESDPRAQALRADVGDDLDQRLRKNHELLALLAGESLVGWGWPAEAGGRGGNAVDRARFYDTLSAAGFGLPESVAALEVLGSALVEFAPAIAARCLPDILAGRAIWCQGFSEPEAGSDLAGLRTRATPVDGGWSITGQKIWTSLGHRADWCGVLARTGDPDSRHRSLTLFWVDMRTSGIDARPLQALTGEEDFSEVFFDDVFVPANQLIGDVDGGWAVAMHLLQFERGMWAWQRQAALHAALGEAIAEADDPAAHAPAIGRAYATLAALRAKCRTTVEQLAGGDRLGPEVSADKVLLGRTEQIVEDTIRALRAGFELSDDPADRGRRREWFYSRAATIYGGAVEVQRNIIATRVLGLPKGV